MKYLWTPSVLLFILLSVCMTACTPDVPTYDKAGFGLSAQANGSEWARRLGAGWYLDWNAACKRPNQNLEYWQTIRLKANGNRPENDEIARLAKECPGNVWIIGNEPDNAAQDNLSAVEYARRYHDLFALIKETDPTAKVAVAGVSQPTPLRMKYLDLVLETYQSNYGTKMPVDWWTVHAYVLREESGSWGAGIPVGMDEKEGKLYEINEHGDLELFAAQLVDFRTWMKKRGYQNSPLAVTEFGILLPERLGFTQDVVSAYLKGTFHWLNETHNAEIGDGIDDDLLVQRWAWFSLSDNIFPTADLANLKENRLTLVGETFRAFSLEMAKKSQK